MLVGGFVVQVDRSTGSKDLRDTLLHIPAEDDVAIGSRTRDYVRLVVRAVTHDIGLDARGFYQNHLAAGRVAFGVFDAGESPGGESCAVQN